MAASRVVTVLINNLMNSYFSRYLIPPQNWIAPVASLQFCFLDDKSLSRHESVYFSASKEETDSLVRSYLSRSLDTIVPHNHRLHFQAILLHAYLLHLGPATDGAELEAKRWDYSQFLQASWPPFHHWDRDPKALEARNHRDNDSLVVVEVMGEQLALMVFGSRLHRVAVIVPGLLWHQLHLVGCMDVMVLYRDLAVDLVESFCFYVLYNNCECPGHQTISFLLYHVIVLQHISVEVVSIAPIHTRCPVRSMSIFEILGVMFKVRLGCFPRRSAWVSRRHGLAKQLGSHRIIGFELPCSIMDF